MFAYLRCRRSLSILLRRAVGGPWELSVPWPLPFAIQLPERTDPSSDECNQQLASALYAADVFSALAGALFRRILRRRYQYHYENRRWAVQVGSLDPGNRMTEREISSPSFACNRRRSYARSIIGYTQSSTSSFSLDVFRHVGLDDSRIVAHFRLVTISAARIHASLFPFRVWVAVTGFCTFSFLFLEQHNTHIRRLM